MEMTEKMVSIKEVVRTELEKRGKSEIVDSIDARWRELHLG